jgi:hypothetical protein
VRSRPEKTFPECLDISKGAYDTERRNTKQAARTMTKLTASDLKAIALSYRMLSLDGSSCAGNGEKIRWIIQAELRCSELEEKLRQGYRRNAALEEQIASYQQRLADQIIRVKATVDKQVTGTGETSRLARHDLCSAGLGF